MKQFLLDFTPEKHIQLKDFSELTIQKWKGKREIINDFLDKYHYFGKVQGWKLCYVVLYKSEIIGVITLGRPVARLEDQIFTLEITRMCFKYRIHNLCSYTLSKIIKDIKTNTHYKRIIAYADTTIHSGSIYLACNFKLIGIKKHSSTWLNRPNRNCTHGINPKAKFEYLIKPSKPSPQILPPNFPQNTFEQS